MKRFLIFTLAVLMTLANAEATRWDLANSTADITMSNGDVLTGTLQPGVAINVTIKAGAKVTFEDAVLVFNPKGSVTKGKAAPAVNCLGDAEITIKGENQIINGGNSYSGIYVPNSKKLTIKGTNADKLYLQGGLYGAGIGAYRDVDAGNIQIEGGTIEAHGGMYGAGIGGSYLANCGTIDIYGGNIKAYGGNRGTGIGSGFDSSNAAYVNITKMAGTSTTVYAQGGFRSPGIGAACLSTCGVISISTGVDVTAVKGDESPCTIGWGFGCSKSHVGNITIGGQTYANGVDRSYFNYPNVHDIDLSKMHSDFIAQNGDVLFGTLGTDEIMIEVAAGATITLRNAVIPERSSGRSVCGIACLGNATIKLEGANEVHHRGSAHFPAIYIEEGKTLTIEGSGSLKAYGATHSAAIGTGARVAFNASILGHTVTDTEDINSGLNKNAGNIIIKSGTVEAYGGNYGPGIGAARHAHCGEISISGTAKVTAIGGYEAPGIGAAGATGIDYPTECGTIRLLGGTIYAQGKGHAPAIGAENNFRDAKCGNIFISGLNKLTAVKGNEAEKCINSTHGGVSVDGTSYPSGITFHTYYYPDSKVIDLSDQHTKIEVPDGYTLIGTLPDNASVEIEDGAEIILDGVGIDNDGGSSNAPAANRAPKGAAVNMNKSGIMLKGSATIRLKGEITVRSRGNGCPGIYVPSGKVLEIKGDGVLNVYGGHKAAGIGGGQDVDAGHIMILDEASVNAYGGYNGAGIGGGYWSNCGEIVIWTDGTVNATGGEDGTGIGSGYDSSNAQKIVIKSGSVNATGDGKSPAIGAGCMSTCGMIYLYSTIRSLKAVKGNQADHSIGKGYGDASQHGGIAMDDKFYSRGIDVSPYLYPNNVIDLATVNSDFTAYHGAILTGKLNGLHKISIEDGATVTLRNAEIRRYAMTTDLNYWPGITCKGRAIIKLEGTNTVTSMDRTNSAIYVPENKTLVIQGPGTLYAHAQGSPASIGAGVGKPCGNIEIQGGRVEAYSLNPEGSFYGAGIGGSSASGSALGTCGNIIITGGTVVARGNSEAPGIGTGANGFPSADKKIYILGGIVYAYGGKDAPAIGAGWGSQIGGVEISEDVEFLRAEAGEGAIYSIGKSMIRPDKTTKCGPVKVEDEVYTEGIIDEVFYYPSEAAYLRYRAPKTINLDTLANWPKLVLVNGDKITGTLPKAMFVSIVKGATVTFENVTINGVNDAQKNYAGVTCEGDAVIQLVGANTVKGNDSQYPAFFVSEGATLQFKGSGSLTAKSWGGAPAIGGKVNTNCGNILLASGTYNLEGGTYCPAIGSAYGYGCGDIEIRDGVTLTARKGASAPNTIGAAKNGTCGSISIGYNTGAVTESPYNFPYTPSWSPNYVNLSNLTPAETFIQVADGAVITGTLPSNVKCQIMLQNGTIKLKDVTIDGSATGDWAGLTLYTGSCTLVLEGTNTIRSFGGDHPAIEVPSDARLTIRGTGSLTATPRATSRSNVAIGSNYSGTITIRGGNITATGGLGSPAIGGNTNCEGIYLEGGTINATGGKNAPAIGAGVSGKIKGITITDGVTKLVAAKGTGGASMAKYSIGADVTDNQYPGTVYIAGAGVRGIVDDVFTWEPGVSDIVDYTITNGETLSGDYTRFHLVAPYGVNFNLKGVTINGTNDKNRKYAGITCNGGSVITMVGGYTNTITGFYEEYPAIQPSDGGSLLFSSDSNPDNKLIVRTNGKAPAIGGIRNQTIRGIYFTNDMYATIEAYGGDSCPAIGTGINGRITDKIEFYDGNLNIKATGGKGAAAIGTAVGATFGTDGYINIEEGVESLVATAGEGAIYSIEGRVVYVEDDRYVDGIEQNPFIYPRSAGLSVRTLYNLESIEGEVNERIRIYPNAIVTFSDVTIGGQEGYDYHEPGVYCYGDAAIILMGHNTVQSFNPNYPGIYVPEGHTLVLYALVGSTDAALDASSKGNVVRLNSVKKVNGRFVPADNSNPKLAAGIGGYIDAEGKVKNCGNILINGANITATGGAGHPGIGGGTSGSCGTITINGGSVLAIGGPEAPGIGAGTSGSCGEIRFTNQVTRVEARAGEGAPNSVGFAETDATIGMESSCSGIIVGHDSYGDGITDRIFIYEPTEEERTEDIEVVSGNTQTKDGKTYKVMINGQLLIVNSNQIYTITGQRVK